jgi:Flp pilus assembly protein TadG
MTIECRMKRDARLAGESRSVFDSHRRHRSVRRPRNRRAVAATELAVCLPLLTLIVFGSIQACNLIYLKHGCVTAAYEGTLELSKPNATNTSIVTRAQQVLTARGLTATSIRITPASDAATASRGTPFTIEVTADVRPNMALSGFFPLPTRVTGQITSTR